MSSLSYAGPCHHKLLCVSSFAVSPLVARSAGFWLVLMYLNLISLFEVCGFSSNVGRTGSPSTEYGLSQEPGVDWPHN